MDVDGAARDVAAGILGEHLHVACEHEQFAFHPLEGLHDAPLLLDLTPIDDRKVVERHSVPFDEAAHVLVNRDDGHDLDGEGWPTSGAAGY